MTKIVANPSPESRYLAYARDRDPSILEGLVREHADRAYTHARRMLGRADLAEDAVQEACLRLIASAGRYRPGIPFAAWFGRLVNAAVIDARRSRSRYRRRLAEAAALPKISEDQGGDDIRMESLRAALTALPETYRAPLMLHYFAGLDSDAVGQALGLRPGTVAVRLTRGIQHLRQRMEQVGFASSMATVVDLLDGMPTYTASPLLQTALAATAKTAVAAAGKVGIGSTAAWLTMAALVVGGATATTAVLVSTQHLEPTAAPTAIDRSAPTHESGERLVRLMPPNSWRSAPGTHLMAVTPDPARYPLIQGTTHTGARSVVSSGSGGALDTRRDRLLIWGGGGSNYLGNEVYAFGIDDLSWSRLTDPTPDPEATAGDVNSDGTPKARTTSGGLVYIADEDCLFSAGGALGGAVNPHADHAWTFDCATNRWRDRGVGGAGYGVCSTYDPQSRLVWWCGDVITGPGGLWSFDSATDAWMQRNADRLYQFSATFDTKRGLVIVVGNGRVFSYDVRRGDFTQQVWSTTGGDAFIAKRTPGLEYDPVRDRIVGWSGGTVYALDPASRSWTAWDAPGAPDPTSTGIFGRWRYVPKLDAFIVVTDADLDVCFYKPPAP